MSSSACGYRGAGHQAVHTRSVVSGSTPSAMQSYALVLKYCTKVKIRILSDNGLLLFSFSLPSSFAFVLHVCGHVTARHCPIYAHRMRAHICGSDNIHTYHFYPSISFTPQCSASSLASSLSCSLEPAPHPHSLNCSHGRRFAPQLSSTTLRASNHLKKLSLVLSFSRSLALSLPPSLPSSPSLVLTASHQSLRVPQQAEWNGESASPATPMQFNLSLSICTDMKLSP